MTRTITDLLAELPEGESRLFKAKHPSADDDRFVEVWSNLNYEPYVWWKNQAEFEEQPWTGTRVKPRIGLDALVEPNITFNGQGSKLVDFHQPGGGAVYLVSPALLAVIERLDPGSLEVRPVVIKAKDGGAPFYFVMPKRLLEAVDPDRCDVQIEAVDIGGGKWRTLVRLSGGAAFHSEITKSIHNFADLDAPNKWFWSRELLAAVKDAGMRGVSASVPATLPTIDIDQF
ncbi:MAG: DUF1629 domain-containing protein [Chakrabartia sp.]